jgi:energy-coupling factor transporter ATP-binding protein EcfA2
LKERGLSPLAFHETADASGRTSDVYLSGVKADRELAEKLATRLREFGATVRTSDWEQPPSSNLPFLFQGFQRDACKWVAVCSKSYLREESVQTEIEAWLRTDADRLINERRFIPILSETGELPAGWERLRAIDFRNPDDFDLRFIQLVEALELSREEGNLAIFPTTRGIRWSGRQFIESVAAFYEACDFQVQRDQKPGSTADFTIAKSDGGVWSKYAILCLEESLAAQEFDVIVEEIGTARKIGGREQWMIVTAKPLAAEIEQKLDKASIEHNSYPQLLADLVPLGEYAARLIRDYEAWQARHWQGKDLFIRPDVFAADGGEREPALAHIAFWLGDAKESLLVMMGDAGSGKSTISKFLAYQLAKNYRDDPWRHPAPILVSLGDYRQELSLKSLIQEHFSQHDLALPDYGRFEYLAGLGRIVLLFDAFDEMASHVDEYVIRANMEELLRPARRGWKVMLTCRTNYFRDYREQTAILESDRAATAVAPDPEPSFAEHLVYMAGLTIEQVRTYLGKARPQSAEADWKKIEELYNLKELLQQPLLLEMILQSLPALQSGQRISAASLYTVYTNRWVEREEDKKRLLTPQFRLKLMMDLAWRMWNDEKDSLDYDELKKFVRDLPPDPAYSAYTTGTVASEIQTASFLRREHQNRGDRFSFTHSSFREYFLARKLHHTLLRPESQREVIRILQTRIFSPEVIRFLVMLDETDVVSRYLRLVFSDSYLAQATENALQVLYWGVRFRLGAGETIHDRTEFRARLAEYLPRGLRLAGAALQKMILEAADLQEANFQRADLSHARFDHALLRKADFRRADVNGASFVGADLTQSDFREAKNLDSAVFTSATLSGVKGLPASS